MSVAAHCETAATRLTMRTAPLRSILSLAWIYTGMVRQFGFRTDQSEWMTRLKASDPENAFPYLLSAEAILNERYGALIYRNSPNDLEVQASVEHDAHWLGDMARAIRTRRLDTYSKNFPVLVLGLLMSTLSDGDGELGSGAVLGPVGPFPDHAGELYQLDEGSPKKYGSKKEYPLLKQLKPLPKNKLFGASGAVSASDDLQ